jgi:nicotinate-nucleotide pyrophosphorylase
LIRGHCRDRLKLRRRSGRSSSATSGTYCVGSRSLVDGQATTEASGGITLATAPALAATGVDLLSIGWLTQSVRALDIGLDYVS